MTSLHRRTAAGICVVLIAGLLAACVSEQAALAKRISHVVHMVEERELRSDEHTPWVIMHAAIAFKSDAMVFDAEAREEVEAIEFLLTRAKHDGELLFRVVDGAPALPRDPAVEHHVNQYLMMLALADVSPGRTVFADAGDRYRVSDLIHAAKRGFEDGQEVGWTLVALSTYVSFHDQWAAANRQTYTITNVLSRGIERDPRDEAEGGTHHLFGVAYAFRRYALEHDDLAGVWRGARAYLSEHAHMVRRSQLDDGAFSAGLLKERKEPDSPSDLVFSTGHTLEWLTFALSEDELREPWVKRAVVRLCEEIEQHPLDAFSDGGIYHAVNALRLYSDAALRSK